MSCFTVPTGRPDRNLKTKGKAEAGATMTRLLHGLVLSVNTAEVVTLGRACSAVCGSASERSPRVPSASPEELLLCVYRSRGKIDGPTGRRAGRWQRHKAARRRVVYQNRGESGPSTPNRTSAPPVLVHSPSASISVETLTDLETLSRLLSRPDAPPGHTYTPLTHNAPLITRESLRYSYSTESQSEVIS